MTPELAVAQPSDAVGARLGEPHRPIRCCGDLPQFGDRRLQCERGHFPAGRDTLDLARRRVGVPGCAVRGDRQPDRFEIGLRLGQTFQFPVADAADRIREVDGEPNGAVGRDCDRGRRVPRFEHRELDHLDARGKHDSPQAERPGQHDDRGECCRDCISATAVSRFVVDFGVDVHRRIGNCGFALRRESQRAASTPSRISSTRNASPPARLSKSTRPRRFPPSRAIRQISP